MANRAVFLLGGPVLNPVLCRPRAAVLQTAGVHGPFHQGAGKPDRPGAGIPKGAVQLHTAVVKREEWALVQLEQKLPPR